MRTICNTIAVAALFAASSLASAFELEHAHGQLKLEHPPARIVSYELAHMDTLDALGIEVAAVPQSVYQGQLEKFNDAPVVGTLFEPDYLALQAQKPDLIIAGGRSAAAIPKLQAIAPTVSFTTDPNDFMSSVRHSVQALAAAWNKEQEAQHWLEQLDKQVLTLQQQNTGKTGILLFTINGRLIPHAPGDRFGYVYELTGLESVLPARTEAQLQQTRPEPGSPEAAAAAKRNAAELTAIAQAEPDWIIMLDRGAINGGEKTAAQTLHNHPELGQTQAVRHGQVYYADPNSWYIVTGGVQNLTTITAELLEQMQ